MTDHPVTDRPVTDGAVTDAPAPSLERTGGPVRLLVLQLDPADPVGRLGQWLGDAGADLTVWAAHEGGERPDGPVDGVLVLGGNGAVGATDDRTSPWLAAVRDELASALAVELPVLAICQGAHMLALAAGGSVGLGEEGPEYGAQLVAKRQAAATDPLLRSAPITPDVVQWHREAITSLPPGATLLASSPSYENQAIRVGRVAWGFQFHIETTQETIEDWARADADALAGYDVARLLERSASVADDLAETWAPVAAAFVEVARDPAAVAAPPRTTVSSAPPIMDPAQIRAALGAEANAARGGPVPLSLPTFSPREPS